jgi:hypothetical protein
LTEHVSGREGSQDGGSDRQRQFEAIHYLRWVVLLLTTLG